MATFGNVASGATGGAPPQLPAPPLPNLSNIQHGPLGPRIPPMAHLMGGPFINQPTFNPVQPNITQQAPTPPMAPPGFSPQPLNQGESIDSAPELQDLLNNLGELGPKAFPDPAQMAQAVHNLTAKDTVSGSVNPYTLYTGNDMRQFIQSMLPQRYHPFVDNLVDTKALQMLAMSQHIPMLDLTSLANAFANNLNVDQYTQSEPLPGRPDGIQDLMEDFNDPSIRAPVVGLSHPIPSALIHELGHAANVGANLVGVRPRAIDQNWLNNPNNPYAKMVQATNGYDIAGQHPWEIPSTAMEAALSFHAPGFSSGFPGSLGYEPMDQYIGQMPAKDMARILSIADDVMDRVNFMKQQAAQGGSQFLLKELPFLRSLAP